ncbi:SDR family oxidoreductase [Solimonas sp. SE-A11]|uniref:SDR family oxidoreductase n=1 Tax=Solimonas sp. SE-A11 TaxID=3054954 RepID=UPI00259D009B|nr:SDR family oxidoreductase [Solimonas sp. SE-A11]MDM4769918.1 SDR family oxidoreductase [Solimonas sp. SE-A11]
MQLQDRCILLTGATGGIGRAAALQLAARGARLWLSGRREAELQELAAQIRREGGRAEVLVADLTERGAARDLIARLRSLEPRLDIVINCAGAMHFGYFESTPPEAIEQLWRTNVLAPMQLVQAALPVLRQGGGLVVNVGSIFGSIAFPCFATYSSTKFALRGFSEGLRRELSGSGVDVLYFAPRYTRTALNSGAVSEMASALAMNQDEPDAVAAALVEAIERNRKERYLGWPEKLFVRINAWFPRLVDAALRKQGQQMRPYALRQLP